MNAVAILQRLHQHRAWVNGNLLTAAATLSDEQLRSAFQIGQGSVWKSLVHLYVVEYVWLEALCGNEEFLVPGDVPGKLPGNQQGEGGITGLDDLRQKWSALKQRWIGYPSRINRQTMAVQCWPDYSQNGSVESPRLDVIFTVGVGATRIQEGAMVNSPGSHLIGASKRNGTFPSRKTWQQDMVQLS